MTSTQHMRQRIVQMAHTLFVQQGVEETTMVAIAEAVGCSRRTVYTYYKDKQAPVSYTHLLSTAKCATPLLEACTSAPPSSSWVTSSPVTVLTTLGPVRNI